MTVGPALVSAIPWGGAFAVAATQTAGIVAICTGVGISLLVKVAYPVADALGQGFAWKVRTLFGSPESEEEGRESSDGT